MRNSQHFALFVTTQKLRDTEVLVSFNVVTQILTPHAIQVTCERLLDEPSWPDRSSLTEDICFIRKLCVAVSYLSFRSKIYQQVHGTAMGSLVSANMVMEDIE